MLLFSEPDLGDQLTGVTFLLDERIWDEKKYPFDDIDNFLLENIDMLSLNEILEFVNELDNILNIRNFIKKFKLTST